MFDEQLAKLAVQARERAYAPYSGFLVGAALLTEGGTVYTGVNIENAAYGPSNCAERTAFFRAVSEGERAFKAIAVAGWREGRPGFAYPCGMCRQVMMEFCAPDTFLILVTDGTSIRGALLRELLPFGFGPENLKRGNVELTNHKFDI